MTPSTLVKNLPGEFFNSFKANGLVRVSLIKEFRNPKYKNKSDDLEGLRGLRLNPKEIIEGKSEEFFPPDSNVKVIGGFIRAHPESNVNIQNELQPVYILCISEKIKPELGDENYQIIDVKGFGEAMTSALKAIGKQIIDWKLEKVEYGGYKDDISTQEEFSRSRTQINEPIEAGYFIKPSDYQHEEEWRYVFIVGNDDEEESPIDIKEKNLIKYCKI